jgi:hypothetical protein
MPFNSSSTPAGKQASKDTRPLRARLTGKTSKLCTAAARLPKLLHRVAVQTPSALGSQVNWSLQQATVTHQVTECLFLLLRRLSLGDPLAALPVLHFALLKYSRHVAAYILQKGVQVSFAKDLQLHLERRREAAGCRHEREHGRLYPASKRASARNSLAVQINMLHAAQHICSRTLCCSTIAGTWPPTSCRRECR